MTYILDQAAFYPGAIYLLSRWYTRKVRANGIIGRIVIFTFSPGACFSFGYSLRRALDIERFRECMVFIMRHAFNRLTIMTSLWPPEFFLTWKENWGSAHGDGKEPHNGYFWD